MEEKTQANDETQIGARLLRMEGNDRAALGCDEYRRDW